LELATEGAQRRGLTLEDAARAARTRTGGVFQAMDALRDQRGLPSIDSLVRDLNFGVRMLTKDRWITPRASIVTRSDYDSSVVATILRDAVRAVDPDLPLFEVMSLDDLLAASDERLGLRVFGSMFAVFALVALLLATVGLYAVTAHAAAHGRVRLGCVWPSARSRRKSGGSSHAARHGSLASDCRSEWLERRASASCCGVCWSGRTPWIR
jgi:hypothetical protein